MHTSNGEKSTFFSVDQVSVSYGSVTALKEVSFSMNEGEILTLIGANGAGKSTILKTISGLKAATQGKIIFCSEDITQTPAHKIVSKKLSHVPEGRGIFLNLSVMENLDLGAWVQKNKMFFQEDLEHVCQLFPRLKERLKQNAGTLSGGEQQMLAIGRALMARPKLLLLDEPSLGLAPQVIEKIFDIIKKINLNGMSVLLVEQNALQALQIAHKGVVLETGHVILKGNAAELLNSSEVKKAYLGG